MSRMARIDPFFNFRTLYWRVGIGKHCYVNKINFYRGSFIICIPWFIISRRYF